MSFLRTFRSNLVLSTAPPSPYGTERDTMRTGSTSKGASGKVSSAGSRKNSATGRSIVEESDRTIDAGRRSSNSGGTMQNRTGSKHSTAGRYGKENPAPIVVYLDKQSDGKKHPTSILRTNTFTRHDEEPERVRHAISRSDTFTINETNDEPVNTGTYTRHGKSTIATTDVFEPLYAKNITLDSQEKLPAVVDSRTYRKKSLKSSKPVQKVESFIKRFERTLFSKGNGGETKRHGSRKGSTTSETTMAPGPRFRDVGINCKLDEEERYKAKLEAIKRSRPSSRDSLASYRERSLSPGKTRLFTSGTYDRRSSSSLSAGIMVQPLKEDEYSYGSSRGSVTPPPGRSTLLQPTESSILKSRQKEIEMGYSVVNKRAPALSIAATPSASGQILVDRNTWRSERDQQDQVVLSNVRERTHHREHATTTRYPARRDTYQTLKDEYERQQKQQVQAQASKPIGIASPRMSAGRIEYAPPSPPSARKDSQTELPKYTFGTDLQNRRSRFQQFQKSFKKMDDSASDVSVQQSFFVPI
ncbi:uncharacterized protein LOC128726608 [Anopheles nili]|uniref:uncharacterized protein LOC128726608 n=1 Tax=Anopheles nili TaxID=185578 RepID=UPI00237AF8FC|nr:uncharacterized protein LOC128726608 [Anopheles nili]